MDTVPGLAPKPQQHDITLCMRGLERTEELRQPGPISPFVVAPGHMIQSSAGRLPYGLQTESAC